MNSKMSEEANSGSEQTALARGELHNAVALRHAAALWADATTGTASPRRHDILRDKQNVIISFFSAVKKSPAEVTPVDVKGWQSSLEAGGLAPSTVYYRLCHLSSFYTWAGRDPVIGQYLTTNPVRLAHPKAPKAYQTESVKALTDEEFVRLLSVVREKAATGSVVGKRDYALLLFYMATGMRRAEIIGLRGKDIELRDNCLVIRTRVKGGDYIGREVKDQRVAESLLNYLRACGRTNALSSDSPLWTRHDYAGRPGAPLTSHAFALNLKRYAKSAGIGDIHLHQTRHTFARMVAEDSGSIIETQDALGHKSVATTRVYVQRIAVRRDRHSQSILNRLEPGG
jgi:integrase/recombinase XerC